MGDTSTWLPDWEVSEKQPPILQGWAAGRSLGDFTVRNDKMAKVSAVDCGCIQRCSRLLPLQYSRQEMVSVIRDCVPENFKTSIYPPRQSSFDAFININ
jgi:hypothetical protein